MPQARISLDFTRHSNPSLPAGLFDYIQFLYRAVVDKFLFVGQQLHVRVKGSIEECRFKFALTSTETHVSCQSYLDVFGDGRWMAVWELLGGGIASRICPI